MIEVEVTHRRIDAEGIVLLELTPTNGTGLPEYSPGAHVDMHLGNGLTRQYSLCGRATDKKSYTVAIQREVESRGGSSHVHDHIEVGSKLKIGSPRNLFSLDPSARRVILFAGGIGITPIISMAEELHASGVEFAMHYCARSRTRMALLDRIIGTPIGHSSFLHADDEPDTKLSDTSSAIGAPTEATHLYVCGPNGFMDHVLKTAGELGWPASQLHQESFSAPAIVESQEKGFELLLARSGRVVTVSPTQTAADALLEAGVDVSIACGQGICGTCITPVLDGLPDHRDMCLSSVDHECNDKFTPCCSRSRSGRLVLDL